MCRDFLNARDQHQLDTHHFRLTVAVALLMREMNGSTVCQKREQRPVATGEKLPDHWARMLHLHYLKQNSSCQEVFGHPFSFISQWN